MGHEADILEVTFGHRPYPIPLGAGVGGRPVLFGFAISESSGLAAAELDIYDGPVGGGGFLAFPITLTAGQSTDEWFGPQGILLRNGLRSTIANGAVQGSLFVCLERHDHYHRE